MTVRRAEVATTTSSAILGYAGAVDERTRCDELGPELLVVPFWTPSFCAAVVRAAGLVGFAADPDDPSPATRCRWRDQPARSTRPSRTTSAGGSGRSCRRCGRSSTTTACATPSSSATPRASRSRCGSTTTSPRSRRPCKLDDDHEGAELRFPRQGVDNAACRSARCWRGRRSSPTPTRRPRCGAGVKHGLTIWFELPFVAASTSDGAVVRPQGRC